MAEKQKASSSPTPASAASPPSDTNPTSTPTSSESGKKRFNLRESLVEVKSLMEGGGSSEEAVPWEERCTAIHRHYQVLARDYKRSEKRLVECQKKQLEVAQHRDVIQTEYARVNVAKGKLENLCRELQKHSKAVAEESKQRQREDEERRKEVSAKFQATINDITMKMQEHHQRNQALRQDNLELVAKLKQLTEQYETREEHYEKLLKHKLLELQLSEAKMAQQMVAAAEEKENSLAEKQYLLAETLEQQKRCEMLTQQETELRGQLAMYSDKFEEFQQTLSRSNQVFSTFKKDTDRMSKTINALEKEVGLWKARYDKASLTLMETTEEKSSLEATVKTLKTKTDKLERLCRAMQAERTKLRDEMKALKDTSTTSQPSETPKSMETCSYQQAEPLSPSRGEVVREVVRGEAEVMVRGEDEVVEVASGRCADEEESKAREAQDSQNGDEASQGTDDSAQEVHSEPK